MLRDFGVSFVRPNLLLFGYFQFNLAIPDLPEVLAEAKKAICGDLITSPIPLCIEISLKTVEGDMMVLETWSLGVMPEQSDPAIRVTYTVYNRMGILLKSLISVSRITPAYKLSRRQGPDSYRLCYRLYMGEPQLHTLGRFLCIIRMIAIYHIHVRSVTAVLACNA